MATREPTDQEQQESLQLYEDINAVLLKVLGPDGQLRSYHSFPQIRNYEVLESKAFYSFFVTPKGVEVRTSVSPQYRTLDAVVRDGESCFIMCISNMRTWKLTYETQPTKLAIVHIVTYNEESFPTVPLRVNRPLVLLIKGPRKFSVSAIPEEADISVEDIDLYPMTTVRSTNLNEVIRMGTRQSVSINVKQDSRQYFRNTHRILINVFDMPMLKPTIALDLGEPWPIFSDRLRGTSSSVAPTTAQNLAESAPEGEGGRSAKRMRGNGAYPAVTATVISQTLPQHLHTVSEPGASTYQQYTQPSTSLIQHPSSVGFPGALTYQQYTQPSTSSGTQYSGEPEDQSSTSMTAQFQHPLSPDYEPPLIIDDDALEGTEEGDEL